MSGTLGGFISAAESAINQITGAATLGGITLTGIQAPEKINFGGKQQAIIHNLPGGVRVIDAMGPEEDDIKFTGTFLGPLASYSAQAIDAMRQSGTPTTLTWGGFSRQVLVTAFEASTQRGGYLYPYSVTCTVIPTVQAAGSGGLLGSLVNDLGTAIGVPNLMGTVGTTMVQAQSALQSVQAALPAVGVLTKGSPAFIAISGDLTSAQSTINSGLAAAGTAMGPILTNAASVGNPLGTTSPTAAISALQSSLSNTQAMAGLSNMANYAGRALQNLNIAGA